MKKLSDYVFEFVSGLNVKHVFMLSGGGSMHLVDSLGRSKSLEYVCTLHEQALSIATEAYSQYTNNFGVGLVTTGPGGTNAVTGLAAAWLDSIPCMFISGQVKTEDMVGNRGIRQGGNQEIRIVQIVKPITKYAATVTRPADIRYHLEKAVHLATTGRPGPVWIDIPLDVQAAMVDAGGLRGFPQYGKRKPPGRKKLRDAVLKTIKLLNNSKRPVLLLGNGTRLAKAEGSTRSLINTLGIPVLLTWKAMDILPENHRLYFGRPGAIASRTANFVQQNSDLVISIGARLDLLQTAYSHGNFAPRAKKVISDIDSSEIKKMKFKIDVAAPFDAKDFIGALLEHAAAVKAGSRSDWLSRCRAWRRAYPVFQKGYWKRKHVNTYVLIDVLSQEMGHADVFVPSSSGASSEIAQQSFKVKEGQRVLCSPGLGSMGFGLSESIGACIASGMRRTVSVEGDGGFIMNVRELQTVARLNLPIKMFVLSNNGYGSIRNTQDAYFQGRYFGSGPASGVVIPDMRKVAKAFGIPSARISSHKELRKKVRTALSAKGPFLCDVIVDPREQTQPRTKSRVLPNGRIVTGKMEDLWPFLTKRELRSNILP